MTNMKTEINWPLWDFIFWTGIVLAVIGMVLIVISILATKPVEP